MRASVRHILLGGRPRTPATVLGSRLLFWLDPSDLSTQWQDDARTTPAAVGAVVGSCRDKAGTLGTHYMQQSVTGSKPVLRSDGGLLYWDHDGTDDGLLSSDTVNFTAYTALTVVVGVRKESDAAVGAVIELGPSVTANDGCFRVGAPGTAGATFGTVSRGTTQVTANSAASYASPYAGVVTGSMDIAAPVVSTRLNGAQVATSASSQGTGAYSNRTLYTGRRNNASLPMTGRTYQIVVAAGILVGDELAFIERYVGAKMGITL